MVNKCGQLIFIAITLHAWESFDYCYTACNIHGFGLKYGWFPDFNGSVLQKGKF